MSLQANNLQRTPRLVRLPIGAEISLGGEATERFFEEGDEQEASGYKNLAVDDDESDAAAARDREFESFDEIPHKRQPLIGLAVLSSVFAVGVAVWMWQTPGRPWTMDSFRKVMAPSTYAAASRLPQQGSVIEPLASEPEGPTIPRASDGPVEPENLDRDLNARRVSKAIPRPSPETVAANRTQALRGHAWSPTVEALVPSEEPSATSLPASSLSASRPAAATAAAEPVVSPRALPAGPGIAPADTGPPPFESARVPVEAVPVLD